MLRVTTFAASEAAEQSVFSFGAILSVLSTSRVFFLQAEHVHKFLKKLLVVKSTNASDVEANTCLPFTSYMFWPNIQYCIYNKISYAFESVKYEDVSKDSSDEYLIEISVSRSLQNLSFNNQIKFCKDKGWHAAP
jgi:hypothetical protein